MRTFPISDANGVPFAVEVENAYVTSRRIAQLIRGVEGVSAVSPRRRFGASPDVRMTFEYRHRSFVVLEPFGDNSRFWIGPDDADAERIDISPIERTLRGYQPSKFAAMIGDLVTLRFASGFRR